MVKKWIMICGAFFATFGSTLHGFAYQPFYGLPSSCYRLYSDQFFVDGELLYWKVQEEGLEYIKYTPGIPNPEPDILPIPLKTNIAEPNFNKWAAGFRVGVGYKGDCGNWYTSLTYTNFTNRYSGHVEAPASAGLSYGIVNRALNVGPTTTIVADSFSAEAHWKLNYNILDWELGAPACLNNKFAVTPFIGLRAAFIDQRYNNDVAGILLVSTLPTTSFLHSERAENDFNSAGIRTGVDMRWKAFCGFGVYAKASTSLLYGRYKIVDNFFDTESLIATDTLTVELIDGFRNRHSRLKVNLEGAIGIEWTKQFCNAGLFTARLGYELIHWFNQNRLPSSILLNASRDYDLGIQGLQLLARYDF